MTRADEWHIKVSQQTKRRYKANAALHGLTLGDNLDRLLDQDELGGTVRLTGGGGAAPRTASRPGRSCGAASGWRIQTGAVRDAKVAQSRK